MAQADVNDVFFEDGRSRINFGDTLIKVKSDTGQGSSLTIRASYNENMPKAWAILAAIPIKSALGSIWLMDMVRRAR